MDGQLKQDLPADLPDTRTPAITVSGGVGRLDAGTLAGVFRRYLPSDWAISTYLAVTGLLVMVWGNGVNNRWKIVLLHMALLMAVYAIVRYLSDSRSRSVRFIRLLYIPLTITFFYEETSLFLHLFHSGWFDGRIIALERSILGVSPTLWVQPWQKPLINEWLMMGYFSYYFIVGIPLLVLFFKRRDLEVAQLTWAISLAFFISYLGFILYPVQGPRFELAGMYQRELNGFFFVPLVAALMKAAAIHGGCMPSSHVAAALVSTVYILKYNRRWGMLCILLVIALCLGTVWGRFHYLSDVMGGILIAVFVLWAASRYPAKKELVNPARWNNTPCPGTS
jgi:membrane-associated phospholipid phosphatase